VGAGRRPVPTITTIGVYDFDADQFIATLRRASVTRVIDVRQRRGVRGPIYAWANARRLQDLLKAAGIGYSHHRELAPTTELRQLQYREDDRAGVGKRNRRQLAPAYVEGYIAEILDRADLGPLLRELEQTSLAALMCVEASAAACHRSLIAARLKRDHGYAVRHLEPAQLRGPGPKPPIRAPSVPSRTFPVTRP
jgi:uncharacterized protein (DUF488 family)